MNKYLNPRELKAYIGGLDSALKLIELNEKNGIRTIKKELKVLIESSSNVEGYQAWLEKDLMRYYVVALDRQSFVEVCEKWGLDHYDHSRVIHCSSIEPMLGIGKDHIEVMVHSNYMRMKNFERIQQELQFIGICKEVPVVWDAEVIDDKNKMSK
jgi:hypothetical protein